MGSEEVDGTTSRCTQPVSMRSRSKQPSWHRRRHLRQMIGSINTPIVSCLSTSICRLGVIMPPGPRWLHDRGDKRCASGAPALFSQGAVHASSAQSVPVDPSPSARSCLPVASCQFPGGGRGARDAPASDVRPITAGGCLNVPCAQIWVASSQPPPGIHQRPPTSTTTTTITYSSSHVMHQPRCLLFHVSQSSWNRAWPSVSPAV